MIDWVFQNREWVFGGIGVVVLVGVVNLFRKKDRQGNSMTIQIHNNNKLALAGVEPKHQAPADHNPENKKHRIRILFIDDDTRFQVVKILKNAGWPHVKIVKDVSSLDAVEVLEANILFVDIQGVGKQLQFTDEGLGLALAIKQKYPNKKVVIYSSQTTGERFHAALRVADHSLAKNADPYEFIQIVEEFSSLSHE